MNRKYNLDYWISTNYYDPINRHNNCYNLYVSEFHTLFLKVFKLLEENEVNIEDKEYLEDFFNYCCHTVERPWLNKPFNSFKEFVEETKKLPLHDDTNGSE